MHLELLIQTITDNLMDITIVFLQTLCFAIKFFDSGDFNINPNEMLDVENRLKYHSIYFYAENFRNF